MVGDYDEGFYALFGFCALELGCVLCGYGWWIGCLWEMEDVRTMVIATVLALVAGGLRIVTRAMERMIARTIRAICVMWTRNLWVSSKERIEDSSCIFVVGRPWV